MKKTLALLFVASLLLAGCTELTESTDEAGDEILNIDVNEEIALEKIDEFLTVDEDESFGITIMYEMDDSMMDGALDFGMDSEDEGESYDDGDSGDEGESNDDGDSEMEEEVEEVIVVEMTEAWSPEGYHSSAEMSLVSSSMNESNSMKMVESLTHIGTTAYLDIGYEIQGDPCEDTEDDGGFCESIFGNLPDVQRYSMVTANTHTEVIAAMAEESQDNSEDMDPMVFLEMVEMIEEYGTFTPAQSVDGLQMFDVAIDGTAIAVQEWADDLLENCDSDENDALSLSEADDCIGFDDSEYETIFNESDTDMNGELSGDELPAFIDAFMALGDDVPTPEEALEMCDADASEGVSWDEFIAEECDDTDSEDMADLESIFNDADTDDSGEITMDELQGFIDAVSAFYEDDTEMDDEMGMGEMPAMQVAFSTTGDIEYFAMEMDQMGEEPVVMKMYILTEEKVNSFFTDTNAGETVALPFTVSYDMYGGDGMGMGGNDGGSEIYWSDYNYCEWEGTGEDDTKWWCTDNEDGSNGFDDWWYYCEDHTASHGSWYCTDDYGQSSDHSTSADNDRYLGGSDDSSDDEGHDQGGDSDETVMYVQSAMNHLEGDMSDYKIELATCESDYDMDTGEETTTCTTVMSVAIADAGEDSDIMFHDADSSGTLSVGDMIHIGETNESWDEVRLYSISADAYGDENPVHNAPGFTGVVGMLALLGAAFIRRNE